jgi:hypothetical protein
MSTTQSTTGTRHASPTSSRLAAACFGLGLVAALLTTALSFLSLVLGVAALTCGVLAVRRVGADVWSAAGTAMAGTSIYVVVLEILVLGG